MSLKTVEINSDLQKFGQQVRQLRQSKKLSQEKLAELTGLHRTYIGGIERGERNVSLLNIIRIARTLEVSPSQLLETLNRSSEQMN